MKSDPKAARDEVALRGQLTTTVLVDLLRTVEASGRDTLIRFVTELGKAQVVFRNGELYDARMGTAEGETAVVRLLGLSDGRFEVIHKRAEGIRTIQSTVMGLVRARERRLKRWSELAERAPSLTAVIAVETTASEKPVPLSLSQRELLALVNGRRTVLEVLDASGREAVEALEDLVVLHEAKLIVQPQQSWFPAQDQTPRGTPSLVQQPTAEAGAFTAPNDNRDGASAPSGEATDRSANPRADSSARGSLLSVPRNLTPSSWRRAARELFRPSAVDPRAIETSAIETSAEDASPREPALASSPPGAPPPDAYLANGAVPATSQAAPSPIADAWGSVPPADSHAIDSRLLDARWVDSTPGVESRSPRTPRITPDSAGSDSTAAAETRAPLTFRLPPEPPRQRPDTVRILADAAVRDLSKTVRIPADTSTTGGVRDLSKTLRIPVESVRSSAVRDLGKTVRLPIGVASQLALTPEAPTPPPRESMSSMAGGDGASDASVAFDRPFVGRYQVLCRIGRGGMGSVYLCKLTGDGGFRRLFALKVLRENLSQEPGFAQRFLEEANLAARVDHPNVVSVVDAAVHAGQPYLVMHYVEGTSLFHLLRRSMESRPPRLIIPIVMGALQGLHAAHSLLDDHGQPENLVHCDVSPDNLLIGIDGVCRIADFGVARTKRLVVHPGADHTRGKPAYVAPEIITGGTVDARSDLFSLAVVLYNALTGTELFAAATQEQVLENVLYQEIRPPSTVGLRPPAALDPIVMKALERDPYRRYPSAEAMLIDLRRVAIAGDLMAPESEIGRWVREVAGSELELRRLASLDASASRNQAHPVRPLPSSMVPPPLPISLSDRGEELLPMTEKLAKTTILTPRKQSRHREAVLVVAGLAMLGIIVMTLLWPGKVSQWFKLDNRSTYNNPVESEPVPPSAMPSASVRKPRTDDPTHIDLIHDSPPAGPGSSRPSVEPLFDTPASQPAQEQPKRNQP